MAQQTDTTRVYHIEEVTISANRFDTKVDSVSSQIFIYHLENSGIRDFNNSASVLHGVQGVTVQKTNNGAGSPFLRGLTGNQTLLLYNGMRINNSIFRYGPNQYSALYPITGIRSMEVLKGNGSVVYGSDALSGVINFIPRFAEPADVSSFEAGFSSGYKFRENSFMYGVDILYRSEKTGVYTSGYLNSFGNTFGGDGVGEQNPSGFDEAAFYISVNSNLSESTNIKLIYNYLKQKEVNRYDQVFQKGYDYFKFDPQINNLLIMELNSKNIFNKNIEFKITGMFNNNFEQRKFRKKGSIISSEEKDEINTFGLKGDLFFNFGNFKVISGFDTYFDRVLSSAFNYNDTSNQINFLRGLYPDNSTALLASLYTQAAYHFENTIITGGIRLNHFRNEIKDRVFSNISLSKTFPVAELSFRYKINNSLALKTAGSFAFRVPNINDLSTFGKFDLGIEVPNPDLNPETSYNISTEAEYKISNSRFIFSLFYTHLNDLLQREPAKYNGADFYENEPVFTKINGGQAYIYGFEIFGEMIITNNINISTALSYVKGDNLTLSEPVRRIPSLTGKTNLSMRMNELFSFNLNFVYATRQNRLSLEDKKDHRIPPGGTPGYLSTNIYFEYRIDRSSIRTGISNLLDIPYKIHGSGVYESGRAFYLSIYLSTADFI